MSSLSLFLVIAQFALLLYLTYTGVFAKGMILKLMQLIGIGISVWGVLAMRIGNFNIQPEVRATTLVQNGPYRWIRNPMYLGILLFFGASLISNFDLRRVISFLLLIIVFLLKISREETFLENHFGANYLNYKSKTKKILPFLF